MPLPVALVFHFNQHTNEYADIANRAGYRGLVKVLRAHPTLKFNLHLSGTLLRALPWFDAETLALIRAGVADGQFELLGSTYAQNVPYACDDWDNAQQIGLHRAVLREMFGVEPTVFWNSERCWRQSLLPVIVEGGYTATLVEDHVLHAAGLAEPVPASTSLNSQSLTMLYDDTLLRSRFNYAAWFGRAGQLMDYFKRVAARPASDDFLLVYAEDAEAMGLWNWERGYVPNATWAHLDALLRELETSGVVTLTHLSSARPQKTLGPLPDGAAQWMDLALLNPNAPYHEDDYSDWFDFNLRSPKVRYFRNLYGIVRARLQSLGSVRNDPGYPRAAVTPADTFYRQALEAFCHHQYEFGCIGVGGRKYWGWENVRSAFLFARLSEAADEPEAYNWIEDVNGDGSDEQLLCDGKQLAVLTSYGGRLIYGFDLAEGRQWAGNQLAIPAAPFDERATHLPDSPARPRVWLPETGDADLKPLKAYKEKEHAPTQMSRHLPPWVFERDAPSLTVYRRKTRLPGQRSLLRSHVGLFTDTLTLDKGEARAADELLDYRLEDNSIFCYLLFPAPNLVVEKRIRQTPAGFAAHYTIDNRDRRGHHLRLTSANELNPDYAAVLPQGRAALDFYMHDDLYPGVVNTQTGAALFLEASREWTRLERAVNFLALELRLTFELALAPRAMTTLEIKLNLVHGFHGLDG
jgi:hypothetical protein